MFIRIPHDPFLLYTMGFLNHASSSYNGCVVVGMKQRIAGSILVILAFGLLIQIAGMMK